MRFKIQASVLCMCHPCDERLSPFTHKRETLSGAPRLWSAPSHFLLGNHVKNANYWSSETQQNGVTCTPSVHGRKALKIKATPRRGRPNLYNVNLSESIWQKKVHISGGSCNQTVSLKTATVPPWQPAALVPSWAFGHTPAGCHRPRFQHMLHNVLMHLKHRDKET